MTDQYISLSPCKSYSGRLSPDVSLRPSPLALSFNNCRCYCRHSRRHRVAFPRHVPAVCHSRKDCPPSPLICQQLSHSCLRMTDHNHHHRRHSRHDLGLKSYRSPCPGNHEWSAWTRSQENVSSTEKGKGGLHIPGHGRCLYHQSWSSRHMCHRNLREIDEHNAQHGTGLSCRTKTTASAASIGVVTAAVATSRTPSAR